MICALRLSLAWGCLSVGASALGSDPREPREAPRATLRAEFERLLENHEALAPEQVGARLAALGPDARPFVLERLGPAPRDPALRACVEFIGRAILPESFADAPAPGVSVAPSAVLAVLAETGLTSDIPLAMEQEGSNELCIEALAGILSRDPSAWAALRRIALEAEPAIACLCLRAAGRDASPGALDWLAQFLFFDLGVDIAVLSQLESVARRTGPPVETELIEAVRQRLWSQDPQVRTKAAQVSVVLEDRGAIPRLVELLHEEDSPRRETVVWALQQLTGLALPPHDGVWSQWLSNEERWYAHRREHLAGELERHKRELVMEAIQELSSHRLYGREIVAMLSPLLDHPDAEVRRITCRSLGRLGTRVAIPALISSLEDDVERVAREAQRALEALGVARR